jgi:uncharacterized protein YjbJ (UPF0337 family)
MRTPEHGARLRHARLGRLIVKLSTSRKGSSMNKDQIKGAGKEAAGEVQEQVGKMTGNTSQELKGHAKEFEGKAQKKMGDVEDKVDDKLDEADREADPKP